MDSQTRKTLVRKRAAVKARVTQIKKYIDNLQENVDVHNVNVRLQLLEKAWEEYSAIQDQLEYEDDDETQEHVLDREVFTETYCDLRARIDRIIADHRRAGEVSAADSQTTRILRDINHSTASKIKLPTIELPKFGGRITEFKHFHDTFSSLIINNEALDDVQKFHYLLSSLTSEAHLLIQTLPVTEQNFHVAWNLLCDRYNNQRLIAAAHVKSLLSLPVINKESATDLRAVITQFQSNLNAVKALDLGIPLHEVLLSQILIEHVDELTRKQWEMKAVTQGVTELEELIHFLEGKCQALELIRASKQPRDTSSNSSMSKQTKHAYVATHNSCVLCKDNHPLYRCKQFKRASSHQRLNIIKQNQLCFNCLSNGHKTQQCSVDWRCKFCSRKHNSLLPCESKPTQKNNSRNDCNNEHQPHMTTSEQNNNSQSGVTVCHASKGRPSSQILLATAIVHVRDKYGQLVKCRALLDSASQGHFVTERLVQLLHLTKYRAHVPVQGINGITRTIYYAASLEVKSRFSEWETNIECAVLPTITGMIPSTFVDCNDWGIPDSLVLADENFNSPNSIDILLGADVFFEVLRHDKKTRTGNYPVLQDTELGWIISGKIPSTAAPEQVIRRNFFICSNGILDQQLRKFWEIEELPSKAWTAEEILCEEHFKEHTKRDDTGRYIVRLPRREDQGKLGASYEQAKRRFHQLERRFQKYPELHETYSEFMREYEELGHMKQISEDTSSVEEELYYLPHHAVFKASSSTTRTRVVFDGSCRTSNGLSLNDTLLVGPKIQQDLYSIVLRFRTYQIAFTADIVKMYCQVKIHLDDRRLQRILWKGSVKEPLRTYELATVTYGTASAPYLATRCLQQLAEDESDDFSLAPEALTNNFYVDDALCGAKTIEDALTLQQELIALLGRGGFPLRKFCANHPSLLEAVPLDCREMKMPVELDHNEGVKTLGLLWHPLSDQFLISKGTCFQTLREPRNTPISKRVVSSLIAALFDPLGLISPVIVVHKIFLQQLWIHKLDWDEQLPSALLKQWMDIYEPLSQVNEITIDRLVLTRGQPTEIQLHGFCDSSERAYGACLYLRSVNQYGEVTIKLLCSKSRVAPVKKITLPRLELCGALLLARLVHKTMPVLNLKIVRTLLWTDSTIVLSWLATSASKWKTFVANRVSQIQEMTTGCEWKHVASSSNPADLISRGTTPRTLKNCKLWWHGPEWLSHDPRKWSTTQVMKRLEPTLEQRNVTAATVMIQCCLAEFIARFSTLSRLQRITAYCLRFAHNARSPSLKRTDHLTSAELRESLHTCIKIAQREIYTQELNDLSKKGQVSSKSQLQSLHPFLDKKDCLRVGGRLQHSYLPYNSKHQVVLPPTHHLTEMIIMNEHLRLLHAGPQLLIASLRQQYWIPRIKRVIRPILHRCLPCFKLKAEASQQLMGQLPVARVTMTRPFLNSGIDYVGPFEVKSGNTRSKTTTKCYVALFICMATKAIHVELVSNLTAEAFIAALRRFIARRGLINHLYSDNGSNFVGASRELKAFFKSEEFLSQVHDYAAKTQFQWHFIPPSSPHFGGLWEAGVKSLKYHWKRIVSKSVLTFEEFNTLITQIEACLNSRPLTALSNDPNDPSYLSPGHFLIGAPLTSLPEPDFTNATMNSLSRWQQVQRFHQQLWKRWSSDYLNSLQQRSKWRNKQPDLQPGMLVLLREDNVPPMSWKLAIIIETFPGPDGHVRVATVKTSSGQFKRPIHKLVLLPVERNSES